MSDIPSKFRCHECEGDGKLMLCGAGIKEWLIDCPECCGSGLTDDGEEWQAAQDKIAANDLAQRTKYEAAIAETRKRRAPPATDGGRFDCEEGKS